MNKKIVNSLVLILSILVVSILFSYIQVEDLVSILNNFHPYYLIAGFCIYSSSHFFKSLRFYILLDKKIAINDLFNVVCVHNLVNNLLPARTGEVSYVYMVKKFYEIPTFKGIETLFVVRVLDVVVISTFFIIVSLMSSNIRDKFYELHIVVLGVIVLVILMLQFLFFKNAYYSILTKILIMFNFEKTSMGHFVLQNGEKLINNFERIGPRKILILFALSFCTWFVSYLVAYILLCGMQVHIPFSEVIIALTFIMLTLILPIQSVGGFGTTEGSWAAAFVLLGMPLDIAILTGFSYHIIQITYFSFLGFYGLVSMKVNKLDILNNKSLE